MSITKFPNGVGTSNTNYLGADGSLVLGGSTITAAEIAALGGTGLSAAELGVLDAVVAGTVTASKAVVVGATKNIDTLVIADGGLKLGAGAGTAVTSTAAELNILDGVTATAAELNTVDASINVETLIAAGAVSATITNTKLELVGAGAVTLAAPGADMLGRTKLIEMTVDNGDVTLSLANVTGGSAATTCTWNDVNDALVLVGGTNKWHVVAESGVVLS